MRQVTASAPGKLLLFGDHAVVYGYPCVVTAVDQRMYVTVEKNSDSVLRVSASDVGLEKYEKNMAEIGSGEIPKAARFIESVLQQFSKKFPFSSGITITTKCDFSSQFGFGSSSATTVALAKALSTLFEKILTNQELFDLCYSAVLDVQKVGSGFDVAAAIWGGTIVYVTPAKVITPLACDELPIIVGYTGVKADTPTIVKKVALLKEQTPEKIEDLFQKSEALVIRVQRAIENKNWSEVGECMNHNHKLLRELNVSSKELENLISAAQTAGAFGAKLSGAGGGDCMLTIASKEKKQNVEKSIKADGGQVMYIALNAPGARIESK